MTATIELPGPTTVPTATTGLRPLALIEARRFARHPLFLVGLGMCALVSAGRHGPEEIDYQVIPAFFFGVLGFVVAARLTRSTGRSRAVVDAAPVSRTTRTAALCLACLVPAIASLAVLVLHRLFLLADPVPPWQRGPYTSTEWFVITAVLPVVMSLGAPLLGVAQARWLRFPGATLLGAVALMFWVNIAAYTPAQSRLDPTSLFSRALHIFTPYTAWGTPNGDGEHPTTSVRIYTGSPVWFAVWALGLCALAAIVALLKDADRPARRMLLRAAVVVAVVLAVSFVLAVAGGQHQLLDSSVDGIVPVHRG